MIKIGIIGAGSISVEHLRSYAKNTECEVKAIADLNVALAQSRANEYGIADVYSDYKDLLADPEIDAVSIVTPTLTHPGIVIDALKSGKNVLCEKPPALCADDVKKCAETAKETGKLLMYGFVCRFMTSVQYLKHYIDSGKMGKIAYGEAVRMFRYEQLNGWFCNKEKSGGYLFDSAIHELDMALYFMGYPQPKSVLAFTSDLNKYLPDKIKSSDFAYQSVDKTKYERTIESFCTALITLDNGATINVKASSILNCVEPKVSVELCGEKAGAQIKKAEGGRVLELLELSDDGYHSVVKPLLNISGDIAFNEQINHFVDCCINKTDCICKPEQAVTLVKIINAVYESAQTGKAVEF